MNPARILIVDDERVVCTGCEKILGEAGYQVKSTLSATKALDILKEEPFDIMITDLKMPELSGMELLKIIREMYPEIMVIVITGYSTVETAVEAMKLGAFDYLPKPFTSEEVSAVVNRSLDKRHQEREAKILRQEREKNLQEVTGEMQRIKTIINSMASGVLVIDRANHIIMSNPAATNMLGTKDTQLVGKLLSHYIKEDKLRQLKYGSDDFHSSGISAISIEFAIEDGGASRFLRAQATPVKSGVGKMLGAVIVLEDITSLKEIDRRKTDFLEIVAHELRAPLAAIAQQLMVVRDGLAGEITEKQREIIGRVKERSDSLLNLTSNLLELSKIEEGRVALTKEHLDLNELLLKVLDLFSAQAEARGVSLQFKGEKELPLVDADLSQIEMVCINLLSNGIKYNREGGIVKVKTGAEGEWVKIEVSDTGVGITPEDLDRVFDKFYRVNSEETRKVVGSGIGLSLAKRIIEMHAGRIEARSTFGKGSTFTFFLPRKDGISARTEGIK